MLSRHSTGVRRVARQFSSDDGFALPMAILIALIIVLFSIVVTSTVVANQFASSKAGARAQLRVQAESGLDEIFTRLRTNPNYLDVDYSGPGGNIGDHPGHSAPDTVAGGLDWATIVDGKVVACSDARTQDCYHVTSVGGGVGDAGDPDDDELVATVEVIARGRCKTADGQGCEYVRYQQRLQRRSYFDWLYLTDLETLDPLILPDYNAGTSAQIKEECNYKWVDVAGNRKDSTFCLNPAYQADNAGSDGLAGPIHTNDTGIFVCTEDAATLRFPDIVEATGTTASEPALPLIDAPGAACSGDAAALQSDGVAAPFLAAGTAEILLPDPGVITGRFQPIAEASNTAAQDYSLVGDYKIRLVASATDTQVSITPQGQESDNPLRALPDGRVIFVDGTIDLAGTLNGKLTIVGTSGIVVTGDLAYYDVVNLPMSLPYDDADRNDLQAALTDGTVDDVLGLLTEMPDPDPEVDVDGGSVSIEWPTVGGGVEVPHRFFHAATLARSVYVDQWETGISPTRQPALGFIGTFATKYRGAFGGYLAINGSLESGYRKDFIFDTRLARNQPPYFLDPSAASWTRVDVIEVPARAGGLAVDPAP